MTSCPPSLAALPCMSCVCLLGPEACPRRQAWLRGAPRHVWNVCARECVLRVLGESGGQWEAVRVARGVQMLAAVCLGRRLLHLCAAHARGVYRSDGGGSVHVCTRATAAASCRCVRRGCVCHTDCRGRVQGRPSLTGLRGVRAHRSTLSRTVALGRVVSRGSLPALIGSGTVLASAGQSARGAVCGRSYTLTHPVLV